MARSVSIPTGAALVAYADASELDPDFGWQDAINNLHWVAKKRFPSLAPCDRWIGREDRAVLENDLAFLTVSEYNGLVAVCIVPKDKRGITWARKIRGIESLAECFGPALISNGRFSNGEQVFIRRDRSTREVISSNGSRW